MHPLPQQDLIGTGIHSHPLPTWASLSTKPCLEALGFLLEKIIIHNLLSALCLVLVQLFRCVSWHARLDNLYSVQWWGGGRAVGVSYLDVGHELFQGHLLLVLMSALDREIIPLGVLFSCNLRRHTFEWESASLHLSPTCTRKCLFTYHRGGIDINFHFHSIHDKQLVVILELEVFTTMKFEAVGGVFIVRLLLTRNHSTVPTQSPR